MLGSGYLGQSLGHSVSCTAFILLEMLERADEDPLPALFALGSLLLQGSFSYNAALHSRLISLFRRRI